MRGWLLFVWLLTVVLLGAPPVAAEHRTPTVAVPQVVGGDTAAPGEFPWLVALVERGDTFPFCGGTLIAARWVLTAAHCLFSDNNTPLMAGSVEVIAGTNTPELENGGQRLGVQRIVRHPAYDNVLERNDIALLELATPADLNDPAVSTLPLLRADRQATLAAPGTAATIAGWGDTNPAGGGAPIALQQAQVPISSDAVCRDIGGGDPTVHICAGGGSADSCYGDSGGPLMVADGQGGMVLAGITSFSVAAQCAAPDIPAGYTRVAAFTSWVAETTGVTTQLPPPIAGGELVYMPLIQVR